ncbi:glycoside hydrolase family 3 N-terminal domain-containing protein [Actinoplanes sp. NPDC051851]|uniref:glycoside hydrolase family 3 protein n=1 Tax=Actinoplanes sp. NPDC051851 TaxID=3154753 RepID=UPI00341556AC
MTTEPIHPYQDAGRDVDQRVEDLLGRLPLESKVALMFQTVAPVGDIHAADPLLNLPPAYDLLNLGITHLNLMGSAPDGRGFAQWSNSLQKIALARPYAIPISFSTDPRHHFGDNPLTQMFSGSFSQWPETLGLAALRSEDLVRRFADIARQEYLAVGIRVSLHPQVDLSTESRWSRINTTFGEDADLTSRLVAAYIRGFQGDALGPASVSTMTKHFPGGGPQLDGNDPHFPWGREQVYPGDNFEYHLKPFRAALAAGARQIMPYYGMPVGTPHEEVGFSFNRSVITGILRDQLGFDGIVCTDWCIVSDNPALGEEDWRARAWGVEHLTRDERLIKVLDAGVDQFGGEHCVDALVDLVKRGAVTEERIDRSARRLLREKFLLGLFDDPYVDEDHAAVTIGHADFMAEGRRAQQASVTLLTNGQAGDGPTLPLTRGLRVYTEGLSDDALDGYAERVSDPADADVAILRLTAPFEPSPRPGMAQFFHHGSLEFPAGQREHILDVCRTTPTVVDVYLDRPAVLGQIAAQASALLVNFGIVEPALVELLFGAAAPQGRLPFDLPRSDAAVAASRTDVPFDTADPQFRFGAGLDFPTTGTA